MRLIYCILGSLISFGSLADTVEMKIEFLKKPPRTGILFAIEPAPNGKNDSLDQKDKV